jgi:hypothetical protein
VVLQAAKAAAEVPTFVNATSAFVDVANADRKTNAVNPLPTVRRSFRMGPSSYQGVELKAAGDDRFLR